MFVSLLCSRSYSTVSARVMDSIQAEPSVTHEGIVVDPHMDDIGMMNSQAATISTPARVEEVRTYDITSTGKIQTVREYQSNPSIPDAYRVSHSR